MEIDMKQLTSPTDFYISYELRIVLPRKNGCGSDCRISRYESTGEAGEQSGREGRTTELSRHVCRGLPVSNCMSG
jgi:hypothetical protein